MRLVCVALLLLGSVACGETARRPRNGVGNSAGAPTSHAGAATSASQGGMAPGGAAGAPAAGGAEEPAGGQGGGGDEGGELLAEPKYRFVILPGLERPEFSQNLKEPTDELSHATEIQAMSSDASVIIGVSTAVISRPTETFALVEKHQVYWRNLAQPQPLGTGEIASQLCLAEDGSAAVLAGFDGPALMHWTLAAGVSPLRVPAGTTASLQACSADAQRGSFLGLQNDRARPLYWQQNDRDLTEIALPPQALELRQFVVGRDAGPAILVVLVPAIPQGAFSYRAYSWTPDMGTQPLPKPPDGPCEVDGASGDISVITGQCDSGSFISRAGSLTMLDEPVQFLGVSRNGRTILGSVTDPGGGRRLVSWQNGTVQQRTSAVARRGWTVTSLSADGLSAYVEADDGVTGLTAKWSTDGQVTLLPTLAGFGRTFLTLASADKGVACGFATNSGHDYDPDGRMVVWDASGVRDVKSELEAAGVWPAGISQVKVEGLGANDQSIFIQGWAAVPGVKLYTGVVLVLPRR